MSAKKNPTDVVIIEDDVWLAEQFQRTLTLGGYSSVMATNGHDAMDIIDSTRPRAVILDMLLTGGTALTLLHEMQSYGDTGAIPVILCTNLASQFEQRDVESYGVRRIIDKTTMHPDDILTAVRKVLV
jgi:DNA-binding NtrC family response regulator